MEQQLDDDEDGTQTTYSKFKSAHEVDPFDLQKFAPKVPQIDGMDELVPFGELMIVVQGTLNVLITSTDPTNVFDLDNIVVTKENREVIGFVHDLIGQISAPIYSVALFPEYLEKYFGALGQPSQA